jgi:hypothetical protein
MGTERLSIRKTKRGYVVEWYEEDGTKWGWGTRNLSKALEFIQGWFEAEEQGPVTRSEPLMPHHGATFDGFKE